MSKLFKAVLIGAATILSAPSQAAFYDWTYQATIQTDAADPLGLNGDQLSMTFRFDSNNVWKAGINNPTTLYFDTNSDFASIIVHSVALNTAIPAAMQWSSGSTHFAEAYDANSFVDLIIDGVTYQMYMWINGQNPPVTDASEGENLLLSHLPTDADNLFARFFAGDAAPVEYLFVQESIQITTVPEPVPLALFGLGFAGLVFVRRRVAH